MPNHDPPADAADPYAAIAAFYDAEHAGFDADLDLYRSIAEVVGDPILELGCGSGRLLVPLAEAGWRVTGLDRSRPMLDRAAAAAEASEVGDRVALHRAELTEADAAPGGPFGLIVVALNGLLHLATAGEQRRALAAARRALDPRGQLVIDVFNPTPDVLRGFDGGVVHEGTWAVPNGGEASKFSARRHVAAEQRIETELWYDLLGTDGTVKRTATRFPMRYLHRAELVLLLELGGFAEWQVYGGYDLEPFDDAAERLIVAAEATASH